MGQHVWLLLATICTELLVITKWSQGQFTEPLPTTVKWAWLVGAALLILYPTFAVSNSLASCCSSFLHADGYLSYSSTFLPECSLVFQASGGTFADSRGRVSPKLNECDMWGWPKPL